MSAVGACMHAHIIAFLLRRSSFLVYNTWLLFHSNLRNCFGDFHITNDYYYYDKYYTKGRRPNFPTVGVLREGFHKRVPSDYFQIQGFGEGGSTQIFVRFHGQNKRILLTSAWWWNMPPQTRIDLSFYEMKCYPFQRNAKTIMSCAGRGWKQLKCYAALSWFGYGINHNSILLIQHVLQLSLATPDTCTSENIA